MDVGMGIFVLGELQLADNKRRDAISHEFSSNYAANELCKEIVENGNRYIFRAKGQVHGLRAAIYGHLIAEDNLIAALKAENANHPLASREAVDMAVKDERLKALSNSEVIRKTYPDGILPKGAVDPDGSVWIAVENLG